MENAKGVFGAMNRNGSFMTSLRAPGMRVSHMVVIDGLDDLGRVIVRDPAGASRYMMHWDEFTRVWEGQSVWRAGL